MGGRVISSDHHKDFRQEGDQLVGNLCHNLRKVSVRSERATTKLNQTKLIIKLN